MNIIKMLFPKAAELAEANKLTESLIGERDDLKKRNKTLWEDYNNLSSAKQKVETDLEEIKTKVREQTDADLMLVSARIIMDTLKGKKPAPSDLNLQRSLLAQQQAMGSFGQESYYPYGGLLGGLGGLFGNH